MTLWEAVLTTGDHRTYRWYVLTRSNLAMDAVKAFEAKVPWATKGANEHRLIPLYTGAVMEGDRVLRIVDGTRLEEL